MRFFSLALLVGSSTALVVNRAVNSTSLDCHEILIPVSASAENRVLPDGLEWGLAMSAAFQQSVSSLMTATVIGDYTIAARYCEPTNLVPKRRNTLQVLVHGATYTKDYWSGLAPPGTLSGQDTYSYILAASQSGYPTLSIDRLCNGASSHPSALTACQIPLEASTITQILLSARVGTLPIPSSRPFTSIILACHSLGSLVCNAVSASAPTAADALVLSGFSAAFANGIDGIATWPLFLPAPQAPLGYLAATRESGAEYLFYASQYSHAIESYDFAHRGTVALGEIATVAFGQVPAPAFSGPVFVLNGDLDAIFCQATPVGPLLMKAGDCSGGSISQGVQALYTASRAFGWFDVPRTGHCVNTHFTAKEAFGRVNEWLEDVGF